MSGSEASGRIMTRNGEGPITGLLRDRLDDVLDFKRGRRAKEAVEGTASYGTGGESRGGDNVGDGIDISIGRNSPGIAREAGRFRMAGLWHSDLEGSE